MRSALLLFCVFALFASDLLALPRFAARSGAKCSDCHVNPTGGGLRNKEGWAYGKNNLMLYKTYSDDSEFEVSPMIGKNILFGADFRSQYIVRFDSAYTKSDFHKMAGSLYFGVMASEKVTLYSRYDFAQSVWEAYAVASILPNDGYIKAGTFTPNYGIRLDDHTAYTRGGDFGVLSGVTAGWIYEPRYTETGFELGYYFSDLAFLTVSAGGAGYPSFSKDPVYTANLLFTPSLGDKANLFFGGSFASIKKGFGPTITNVNSFGGYLGFGIGNFSLLAEFDNAKNLVMKDSTASALMIEASYKLTKGLDAVVRYDKFDPNTNADKNELGHIVIGFDYFPYSFVELKPQYRINTEEPKYDNNAFVLQFHFWY